jgi:hypothetical protein
LEALAQGVPQVAIPVTSDQPGVAARIAEKKTGLFVPLKELTASRLEVELWISGSSLVVLIIQTAILVKCRANNMRL